MKANLFQITVFLLFFAGSFTSCKDKEVTQDITQKCECEHEAKYIKTIERKNIPLSDSTEDMGKVFIMFPMEHMIYDFALKNSFFVMYEGRTALCKICNFPFDKLEDVSKQRLSISFTADVYEECTPSEPLNILHYEIVLTSFKIETK